MKEVKRLWSWLAIPCIALAVLTGSILPVLLVQGFYTVQIGPLGICEASGLTRQQAAEAFGDVMDYCMGRRPDFAAGVLPFTVFHSIFFPGKDNWLFDPVTDPVILILPEAFFRNCAIAIVTVLLTVCIMLVVTGRKRPSCRSAPGEGTAS